MNVLRLVALLIYTFGALAYGAILYLRVGEDEHGGWAAHDRRSEPTNPALDRVNAALIVGAAIVNLDSVRELSPTAGGHGELTLKDGSKHEVSRRRFKELTERLGG